MSPDHPWLILWCRPKILLFIFEQLCVPPTLNNRTSLLLLVVEAHLRDFMKLEFEILEVIFLKSLGLI